MYKVFLFNVYYYLEEEFNTRDEADKAGEASGFEYVVIPSEEIEEC
ncbi:MAG: hypothetical protein VW270_25060 [Candidatus Poseidoniales archaeon]